MSILTTINNFTKLLDGCEKIDICFFDFSKALNALNRWVVCVKLESLGGYPKVLPCINFFQPSRSLKVTLGVVTVQRSLCPPCSRIVLSNISLLFLVMVYDLPGVIRPYFSLLADDMTIEWGTMQIEDIQANLCAVYAWAWRNDMLLNASKANNFIVADLKYSPSQSQMILELLFFPQWLVRLSKCSGLHFEDRWMACPRYLPHILRCTG